MTNSELLVTMVEDAAVASQLATDLIHQVQAKGCVLKPEALPSLDKCAQRLQTASIAAQTLARRARGEEEPKQG